MSAVRSSVRFRLTLWYAAALGVIVLLFAGGVYALVSWSLANQTQHQVRENLVAVEKAYREGGDELEEIDEHGSVAHFHVAEGGALHYQSTAWRRLQLTDALEQRRGADSWSWSTPSGEPFVIRVLTLNDCATPTVLAAAVSGRLPRASLSALATVLLVGLPVAISVAAIGGYWLAGRALAPVNAITSAAREITSERLSDRLPVANPHDEFGRLATVFNDVLGRLQNSFERLRRFTSDASHELRTPLTAIRSVGEVALQDNRAAADYREVIGSMLEEADRLTRLLDTLLILTRADSDLASIRRERVDIATMAHEVGELLRTLAEERGQTLSVDAAAPLHAEADPNLLREALVNLIDNAVKYTPVRGAVRVRAYLSSRDEVVVEVGDSGPGIAAEHQPRVFDRFYRVDQARARETGGVGLGLALAKWAVEINGGRIELESEPGRGSTFRIVLPGHAALQRSQESGFHEVDTKGVSL